VSRRRLVWLGAICGMAAVLSVLIGVVGSLGAFQLVNLRAAPEAGFAVDTPGDWVVASQTRAVVDGVSLVGAAVTIDQMSMHNPDGVSVPLRAPARVLRYRQSDREGVVIGVFDARLRGSWRLSVAGGGEGVLLAIGPDPVGAVSTWMLLSAAVAIVLLGVACSLGWIAWRR
jgi:hypothetical protein